LVLASNIDYYSIREEYNTLNDKRKALEQTYNCLKEQLKLRKQGKSWKLKKMFQSSKSNYFVIVNNNKKDGKTTSRAKFESIPNIQVGLPPQPAKLEHKNDHEDKMKMIAE
jgi:hypothetical protein